MSTSSQMSATSLERVDLPERYEVRGQIAGGRMTTVWCAHDAALGHKVAIKMLAERFVGDDLVIRRFEHEARTAACLSAHPHVVMIFGVAEAAGRPYIVMEHLAGGTVAEAFRVGAVRREEALRWLAEAASALDYAHACGVVHGEVKLGNLLLSLDRAVHVTDFGFTRVASQDTLTGTGQSLGAAAYLSPEQALGAPASSASDRYALAAAAFELLVGQRPFTAEHFGAAPQHIADDPPRASSRNPTLRPAVDAVLARGMAKRPKDRWRAGGAFVDALDAAFSRPSPACRVTTVQAPRHARQTTRPKRPKRPRRTVAIAALAAAGVAVGTVVAMSQGGTVSHERASGTLARISPPASRRVSASHRTPVPAAPTATTSAAPSARATGSASPGASTPTPAAPSARATGSASPGASTRTPAAPGARATVSAPPGASTRTPAAPSATATTPAAAITKTTTSATPPASQPPTANALEARGHQLMLDGAYTSAIPVLRQAIAAAPPADLTYAYALYDLGRSLRLTGDAEAAIPILERRLKIPNQTQVVLNELRLAQHAGDRSGSAAGTATASSRGRHHLTPGHSDDGGAPIRTTGETR
jgi:eukaryotic-like serine/threonine-protein kinase